MKQKKQANDLCSKIKRCSKKCWMKHQGLRNFYYCGLIRKEARKWEKAFKNSLDKDYQENVQETFSRIKAFYYSEKSYASLVEKEKKCYYDILLQRYFRLKNEQQAFAQVPGLAASIFIGIFLGNALETDNVIEYVFMSSNKILTLLVAGWFILSIVSRVVYNDYDALVKEKELFLLEHLLKKGGLLLDDSQVNI